MGGVRPGLCLTVLILLMALPLPLYSDETDGFQVEQAVVTLPNIKVYARIPDTASADNDTSRIKITGTLGTAQTATVDVKPFAQSGEGVGYVFLVDISASLKPPQFQHMREAISNMIDKMARKDMAGIITFGKDVNIACDYTADKNELKAKINKLKPSDELTQLHRGLVKAVEMGRRKDASLPARKVIITLSDGEDDFAGGMTKDEVIDVFKVDRVPIYAIGFYSPPSTPKKDEHLKTLGEFARRSGGELIRANNLPYDEIYTMLHNRIRNSYIINLKCADCSGDGQVFRLQLALTAGTAQIADGMDIRILPRAKPSPRPTPAMPKPVAPVEGREPHTTAAQLYLIFAVTILLVLITIIAMRRKRRLRQQHNAARTAYAATTDVQRLNEGQPQPARGIRLKFTVLNRTQKTMSYEAVLDKPIVMGRNKAYCAVTVTDDIEISGVHCEISKSGGKFYIKDLGSTNGTMVNGVSLTSVQKINDGDTITLGQTELRISMPAQEDRQPDQQADK
ncbi:MAG: VWA domain-containing protein [Nitrospirae bacterium]|nr:VWA domain-containing protein [Nitrospirota bacterium]